MEQEKKSDKRKRCEEKKAEKKVKQEDKDEKGKDR